MGHTSCKFMHVLCFMWYLSHRFMLALCVLCHVFVVVCVVSVVSAVSVASVIVRPMLYGAGVSS